MNCVNTFTSHCVFYLRQGGGNECSSLFSLVHAQRRSHMLVAEPLAGAIVVVRHNREHKLRPKHAHILHSVASAAGSRILRLAVHPASTPPCLCTALRCFLDIAMGRLLAPLAVFAAFATLAHAGITFTSPEAGDKLRAGSTIEVEWKEGGSGPKLSDLTTYELHLCAGGNDPSTIVGAAESCGQGSY
jgi:hypothetical protein